MNSFYLQRMDSLRRDNKLQENNIPNTQLTILFIALKFKSDEKEQFGVVKIQIVLQKSIKIRKSANCFGNNPYICTVKLVKDDEH